MLYDVIKPQGDPSFGVLASSNFSQGWSGSGVTYVERSRPEAVGGPPDYAAFFSTYGGEDGNTYLVGGTVTGGTGNFVQKDIKIYNDEGEPVQSSGKNMILGVTGNGYVQDGVLLPGFTATAISIAYVKIPDNTLPTATSPSGKRFYINLGVFTKTAFIPSGRGNFVVDFCPGSYSVYRF